tara:strand:- start:3962 stop:4426 length:465 start_codon:yes stop_codon:yes gene_type:complete
MIVFLVLSICLYVSILCSSIASVMVSDVEPDPAAPSPTQAILDDMVEAIPEPEPVAFDVEEEPIAPAKKETFKLIRDQDYDGADVYHHNPGEKEKCLADCAGDQLCKAVVFDSGMTMCWGKQMADFEMPLHFSRPGRHVYVKKDSYEEAVKKYG